ncbi:MAG: HEAT repeat domain-containing protein [Anaerolineae bacterium]|nr:HEAT repeat domain-containing protein [Anaerolineae bacterium]
MGFDVENFGIGLLTGWATAYGVYRVRHLISSVVQSASQQASSAQNYATQTADKRYINDVVQMAQTSHLAGGFTQLSEILVEPRFLPAQTLAAPPDDDVIRSVFHVVPNISDYPYLGAPYNLETLSIDDLSTGDRALALLGNPGSGRTTALMSILLRALGHVEFNLPVDKVQQRIDAEEAKLDDKQRAVRIKERLAIEQRAKERLAEERGQSFDTDADDKAGLHLFNRLMPVYVHLADINVRDPEFSNEVDPAEPLVRAVQRQMGRVAASALPRNLYLRLSRGQVLLLVDGYDDLPENERSRQLNWLASLMDAYTYNFFIVAGPSTGYGNLTSRLGLTPIFLRSWTDQDMERAAERWASIWPELARSRRSAASKPDGETIQRAKTNTRATSPFDLTLKIWANYANDTEAAGFEGWIRAYLARHLPSGQSLDLILPQVAQAAALQLDEGYITQAKLTELVTGKIAPEASATESDAKTKKVKKEAAEDTNAQAKLLAMLQKSSLLVNYTGGRYQFRHFFLAAYLASLTLKDATTEQLSNKSLLPAWNQALAYANLHRPMDEVVRARLNMPPDMLYQNALEIANWLPYTSLDTAWRGTYLKQLGTMLVAPSQYPLLRERATAALVGTRDKSVLTLFRQATRSPNPHLRRLACLGLGAFGEPEVVSDLVPLLNDQDGDVQLSAALGLGAVRTEEALTALVEAFTEGSEQLRQAVAETFADIPAEGYPVLYDAIHDEEMMLRRAAVFGLRRVKSGWALISIYRAFLEDEQWYVRSAAQMAFQELQYGKDNGPHGYPPPESIPWLTDWAAKRGENVPPGEGAIQILMRALQEGEPSIRLYAAANLGQLGMASTARSLYTALRDKQADVREAAHRALAELQMQIGESLPAPN